MRVLIQRAVAHRKAEAAVRLLSVKRYHRRGTRDPQLQQRCMTCFVNGRHEALLLCHTRNIRRYLQNGGQYRPDKVSHGDDRAALIGGKDSRLVQGAFQFGAGAVGQHLCQIRQADVRRHRLSL